ncbi:circadian-associated transcriptional repressor-like [Cyclopterus lumpus]|uniref:circadian-associated transcriptional repressor-like n=1 Tax=Cyclopterus lumpus TaxID=8103 RepID=UPI001485D37A|nr:circadian-associated transcriptional repressor-like [Cyclopterus lumpus]XP_034385666.1 circadian-associated transcriptional repressor-like [Cyclopterus lumpus]XP_034385667.1 circadian-associated transcriptional repressor-like [Cyclopterus lumpus]
MSTSDSDDSIDWLASDEDEDPKSSSPHRAEESPLPPSSSSSSSSPSSSLSSSRESPTSCFHSQRKKKKKRRRRSDSLDGGRRGVDADSPAASPSSPVAPLQGFTSPSERLSAASKRRSSGKRRGGEETAPDAEEELFSQKSGDLQLYLQPLSSILRALRSGRYSDRLSSFQESVAVDRIQRIMGVLENPLTSGRFLGTILKIEAMLQSWFPHIGPDRGAKKQKRHGGASSSPPPSSGRLHPSPVRTLKTPEPTQDSAVSSSTDPGPPPPGRRLGFKLRSPCLERLLQAKGSVVAPRTELTRGPIRARPALTEETTRP